MLNIYQAIEEQVGVSNASLEPDMVNVWHDLVLKFEAQQTIQGIRISDIKDKMHRLSN